MSTTAIPLITMTRRLNENWDMTFGQGLANFVYNQDSMAQSLKARLWTLLGEWFLDTSAGCFDINSDDSTGLGWKPLNLPYQEAIAKQTILQTDGVDEITSFSMFWDSSTRSLTINASVTNIWGTTTGIAVAVTNSLGYTIQQLIVQSASYAATFLAQASPSNPNAYYVLGAISSSGLVDVNAVKQINTWSTQTGLSVIQLAALYLLGVLNQYVNPGT